jgi:hypothetical protein
VVDTVHQAKMEALLPEVTAVQVAAALIMCQAQHLQVVLALLDKDQTGLLPLMQVLLMVLELVVVQDKSVKLEVVLLAV